MPRASLRARALSLRYTSADSVKCFTPLMKSEFSEISELVNIYKIYFKGVVFGIK